MKRRFKRVGLALLLLLLVVASTKQQAFAETTRETENAESIFSAVGAQQIARDGVVYTLYKVEQKAQPQTRATFSGTGEVVENDTVYYYRSVANDDYLMGDKSVSTYYAGTKRATLRQITEWSYRDGISATLESYEDVFTYLSGTTFGFTLDAGVSLDTYGNATYTYWFYLHIPEKVLNSSVSTTCTIYGEIY